MKKTIAIPYLSIHRESLYRDGLGKFLGMLVNGIMQYDPEVLFEIWTYSQGVPGVKEMFSQYLDEGLDRISYIDDYDIYRKTNRYKKDKKSGASEEEIRVNYENKIAVSRLSKRTGKPSLINKALKASDIVWHKHNLVKSIKASSNADAVYYFSPCFIPILGIKKPTLVQIHDMFTIQYEKEFVKQSIRHLITNRTIAFFLGLQSLSNAHFVCSSGNTLNNQILKYIPFVKKENTHIVRFPAMIKDYKDVADKGKEAFCAEHGITAPYIAYPTQNRPNKNIITLLKAMKCLKEMNVNVQLVLTGQFGGVKICQEYIDNNPDIQDMLVETGNLSDEDLYLLYKHADMVVSTSFVEGACISGQVLEALKIGNIPVVCALLDGVDEWLSVHGFDRKTADMNWFERFDYETLAKTIKDVLENREEHLKKQEHIFREIVEPTWPETGKAYLDLIDSI